LVDQIRSSVCELDDPRFTMDNFPSILFEVINLLYKDKEVTIITRKYKNDFKSVDISQPKRCISRNPLETKPMREKASCSFSVVFGKMIYERDETRKEKLLDEIISQKKDIRLFKQQMTKLTS